MKTIAQQKGITSFPYQEFDSNGNTIYFELPEGLWWKKEYDSNGKVIYSENSYGGWSRREYDSNGNLIYFENSEGYWTKSEYDSKGFEIYYEDSEGYWEKYEYDSKGDQLYFENSKQEIEDNRPKNQDTKQQTVVEWLVDKFSKHYAIHQLEDEINQAKQMFEQQIIQAYNQDLYGGLSGGKKFDDGKHYYNETFKSE